MRAVVGSILMMAGLGGAPSGVNMAHAAERAQEAPVGLDVFAEMMGRKLKKKEVRLLEASVTDERVEVRALAVALLMGRDPERWRPAFAEIFAVHADPSAPEAVQTTTVAVSAAMKEVYAARPDFPPELQSLLAFLQYRDANAWLENPSGPLSVASFWRSNFLTFAWAEAESKGRIERMALLRDLDRAVADK